MKFDEYETLYQLTRRSPELKGLVNTTTPTDFYLELANTILESPPYDAQSETYVVRAAQEGLWYTKGRPFYKVWPSIIPAFVKTRIDFRLAELKLDNMVYGIFLPAGQGSILVTTHDTPAISITVQLSDGNTATTRLFADERAIEDTVDSHPQFTPKLKLAIAVIMLANDPTLIDREVLSKDRLKWEQTRDPKYVEKAIRRGVNGWRIGEKYEVIPHLRRPHFGYRWTGVGRTQLKLRPIKGSIVHREKVTQVPTDHLQ